MVFIDYIAYLFFIVIPIVLLCSYYFYLIINSYKEDKIKHWITSLFVLFTTMFIIIFFTFLTASIFALETQKIEAVNIIERVETKDIIDELEKRLENKN